MKANITGRSALGRSLVAALTLTAICSFPGAARAVDVFTDPVGFYQVTLLTNSDTYVSIPFQRLPVFTGLITAISGGNQITVNGNPGWTANQFVYQAGVQPNTYYAFIASGTKEGAYYDITANGSNTLTVDLTPEDLTGVAAGDRIMVVPYWTLGTAFPGGQGITPSTGTTLLTRKTEILFPNIGAAGINIPAGATYYYFNGWKQQGGGAADDQIILPEQYFIVRQRNQAPTTTWAPPAGVPMYKSRIPLYTQVGAKQDNFVAVWRPAAQTLNESQLFQSGAFVASTSTTLLGRRDELLVFDNTVQQFNKPAIATYYYFNGAWRNQANSGVDAGNDQVFQPGKGYIIRKYNGNGSPSIWVNTKNY